ncbi:MAG: putative sulfate/molybdate transporter [Negativicutes bacterium]|nr:putative sulfate/molybdate transporter [Negativicutes bacterium]
MHKLAMACTQPRGQAFFAGLKRCRRPERQTLPGRRMRGMSDGNEKTGTKQAWVRQGVAGLERQRFSWWRECSGGLADIGLMLPILVGLAAAGKVNGWLSLLMVGAYYLFVSWFYRIPVPVQPLKAFSAVALVTPAVTDEVVRIGAIILGASYLLLTWTPLLAAVRVLFPLPVVRGVQLATGLLLLKAGYAAVAGPELFLAGGRWQWTVAGMTVCLNWLLAAGFGWLMLCGLNSRRWPVGLVAAALAVAVAAGSSGYLATDGLIGQAVQPPAMGDWRQAAVAAVILLVLPQLPLSVGNAIIATENAVQQFYRRRAYRVRASRLAGDMGVFAIVAGLLGVVPCCHGCGGVTAHYKFGARSWGAPLAAGIFYCLLAVLVYCGWPLIAGFPQAVFGVMLIYTGLEHCLLISDLQAGPQLATAVLIGGLGLLSGSLVLALAAGWLYRLATSHRSGR